MIGSALSRYFLVINQEELLKGYWRESNSTYNITMFYLDKDVGAVSYVYIGTSADLLDLGITSISGSSAQTAQTNSTINGNATATNNSSTMNTYGHSPT